MKRPVVKSSALYDNLKKAALIWMPAFATLYFALGNLWGLPYVDEITGTITAIDLFLGTVLHFDKKAYDKSEEKFDGTIVDDGTREVPVFEFNEPLENLVTKNEVTLKVHKTDTDDI